MNDDPLQNNQPKNPSDDLGTLGDETTVPRRLGAWRPADEIEGGESPLLTTEDDEMLLSTPTRIDLSRDPAVVDALEVSDDSLNHYGDSLDMAYDDAPSEPPLLDSRDRELDLMEHLIELRQRLLRSFAAIGIAMVLTWNYRESLLQWFGAPLVQEVEKAGGHLIVLNPMEGFTMYLQISFAAAVLLVIPIVLYQLWAFIEPALTRKERRYGIVLVPFSVTLFFVGSLFGFYMTPLFFRFFLGFTPPHAVANWSYESSATLLLKMLLVFGISFQVPVITIFVNKIGLVSRNWMIEYWRHVVTVMFIIIAIITPTWDPLSLFVAAVPPCLLYGLSIWMVKWL